jgi:hypothetical protein
VALHLSWTPCPCPRGLSSPLLHHPEPLGSTIYDRSHARDLLERSWAWAESQGSHGPLPNGDRGSSNRTSHEARRVERDSAEVAT